MRPVVLLSDFGTADHYVGAMHAVLVRDAPGVERVDLTHQVPPGDLWTAAFELRCAWPHLPTDAVVLAVVDPGVGTARRAVAARVGSRWLVAPDNGLAAAVGVPDEVVRLEAAAMDLEPPSATFHGRDLFAPAAARLAVGAAGGSLGGRLEPATLVPCPLPEPRVVASGWAAVVLHVDRFGNVVLNLPAAAVDRPVVVRGEGFEVGRRVHTYAEAPAGELVLLEGSSGLLELALDGTSAADRTGLVRGDAIEVRLEGGG